MKNNYLIRKTEKLSFRGLSWIGSIVLGAFLVLSSLTATAQIPCVPKIEFTVQAIDESADGASDAKLVLSGVPATNFLVGYSSGGTFGGSLGAFSALTDAVETLTLGSYVAEGLSNPALAAGDTYTVRVQTPDNACYSDSTVTLPRVNWTETPDYTDLEIVTAKSGDASQIGDVITVTVTVTNNDTNVGVTTVDASGVQIAVYTPASGLTYNAASATTGSGTFSDGTMIWNVGTVAAGASLTLQLTYTVTDRGVFQVGAEVKTTTGTIEELDSVPLDDDGGTDFEDEDDEGSICISTPWDWCDTDEFTFTLLSGVYDDIIWVKNGSDIVASVAGEYTINGDGSLLILSIGTYNFRYVDPSGTGCDMNGCCPIIVEQGVLPTLQDIDPEAICFDETLPTVIAVDGTAYPGDYDPDRGPAVYQWFNNNGTDNPTTDTLAGQTTLTLDLSLLPQTEGAYSYRIIAKDSQHTTCLDTTDFEFVITDIQKPIANANTPICEEEQIELTVTNMTDYVPAVNYDYNWWYEADSSWFDAGDSVGRLDADPSWSGDYVVMVSQTFSNTFGATTINTYCAKYDTVAMVVNPLPTIPTMRDSTYCQYEFVDELVVHVVDSSTVPGEYLNWYLTSASTAGTAYATNAPAVLSAKPDSSVATTWGPFYVTQTDLNGCESYPDSFVVNINALPVPPVVADLAYCEGTTGIAPLTATPLAGTGYTLTWYDDTLATGAGGTPASPLIPTPDASAVDTLRFYVTQTLDATTCESYNAELIVYIKDTPDAPAFDDPTYCLDETAVALNNHLTPSTVSSTSPTNTYVHWTYPGFTDDGILIPTPTTTDAGSVYGLVWEEFVYLAPDASSLSCVGDTEDLRVVINPKPEVDLIAVNALCIGDDQQTDGQLYLTEYRDSDLLRWHLGAVFSSGNGSITDVTGIAIESQGGVFASNLSNPTVGSGPTSYAVEITNEFGCVETGTVDMTEKDCICPGGYCEPASITRQL